MPQLLSIYGYTVSFWSNEAGEPVHVHVHQRSNSRVSMKLWLSKNGNFILDTRHKNLINKHDTMRIIVTLNRYNTYLLSRWVDVFGSSRFFDE